MFCPSVPGHSSVQIVKYLCLMGSNRSRVCTGTSEKTVENKEPLSGGLFLIFLSPHQKSFSGFDFMQVFASFNFHQGKPSAKRLLRIVFPCAICCLQNFFFFLSFQNIYIPIKTPQHVSNIMVNRLRVEFGTKLEDWLKHKMR